MLTTSFPRWKGDPSGPFVYRLCEKLVKKGVEMSVVAPHDIGTSKHERMGDIEVYRFSYMYPKSHQCIAYGSGMAENITNSFLAKVQLPIFFLKFLLKGLSTARKADIIHAQWIISGLVALMLKRVYGKKIVLSVHRIVEKKGLLGRINRYVLQNVDFVIFNSRYTSNEARDFSKISNWAIIPPGTDILVFKKSNVKELLRKDYGLDKNSKILFILGRHVEKKGFNYLLGAFKTVRKIHPDTYLIIGGRGPLTEKLKLMSKQLGILDVTFFPGVIPDEKLVRYYDEADIFILPSIIDAQGETETLGVVLQEAMACETPVIGSNVGGIPDIIDDNINGFLIEQKNPDAIAEKINYLLSNPDIGERFGKAGRKKIKNEFSWEKIADRTIEIYIQGLKEQRNCW